MKILNDIQLNELCRNIAQETNYNLYDFVLYKDGQSFRYVHQSANMCNDSYSVSKVFTMTAVGMLVDEGKISLDDRITDILADEISASPAPGWEKVTVAHALCHKMGVRGMYLDIDSDDVRAYPSRDYLSLVLSRKLAYEPGSKYGYSDAAYYLASRVVSKITGQILDAYLTEKLFRPIDFAEMAWSKCPYGYAMGATGLYCRTEDMLKLAVLYMDDGVWEGKRYVSSQWVKTALEQQFDWYPSTTAYQKGGAFGQCIAFDTESRQAIAFHAFQDQPSQFADRVFAEILCKK